MVDSPRRQPCVEGHEEIGGNEEDGLAEIPYAIVLHEAGVMVDSPSYTERGSVDEPPELFHRSSVGAVYVPRDNETDRASPGNPLPNPPHRGFAFHAITRKNSIRWGLLWEGTARVGNPLARSESNHSRYTLGISGLASLNGLSGEGVPPPAIRLASSFCPRSRRSGL